jgi:hypothetical protein
VAILDSNQPALPRAITVRATVANMQTRRGPPIAHYNLALDVGRVYRFEVANVLVDDGLTVLDVSGGTPGRWLEVRRVLDGVDLVDGAQDLTVGGNVLRFLPAATLTANSVATLKTTNAERGDVIRITREDVGAFTFAVDNDGPGAGTLHTFPVSVAGWAEFYFDGTNWRRTAFG